MTKSAPLLAGRYLLAQPAPEADNGPWLLPARDEHLDRPVTIIWPLPPAPEPAGRPFLNAAWQPVLFDRGEWETHDFLVCEPLAEFWLTRPAPDEATARSFLSQFTSLLAQQRAAGRPWPALPETYFVRPAKAPQTVRLVGLAASELVETRYLAELGELLARWLGANSAWLPMLPSLRAGDFGLNELTAALGGSAEPATTATPATETPRLLVYRDGALQGEYPLTNPQLLVGSQADCDIQLVGGGMAGRHVQLSCPDPLAPGSAWQVAPLTQAETTTIDGRQLLLHRAEEWLPGQWLQLGLYALRWQPAADASLVDDPIAWQQAVTVMPTPAQTTLAPGESTSYQLLIRNQSEVVLRGWLGVTGLPGGWVTLSERLLELMPEQELLLVVGVQLPAGSQARAGARRWQLTLTPELNARPQPIAELGLRISPVGDFAIQLHPNQLSRRGTIDLHIQNLGNTPADFTIQARDSAARLTFSLPATDVTIAGGQTEIVPLQIEAGKPPWLGGTINYPFVVRVTGPGGQLLSQSGQLDQPPRLPYWIFAILGALLVGLCGLLGLLYNGYSQRQDAAAATTQAIEDEAGLSATLTRAFEQAQPTPAVVPSLTPFPTLTSEPEVILPHEAPSFTMFSVEDSVAAAAGGRQPIP